MARGRNQLVALLAVKLQVIKMGICSSSNAMALNPLAKEEIAKKFGVHVSTIVSLHIYISLDISLDIFTCTQISLLPLPSSSHLLSLLLTLVSFFGFCLQLFVPAGKDSITKALKKRPTDKNSRCDYRNSQSFSTNSSQSWRNVRVLYLQAGTHTSPIWKDMPKINVWEDKIQKAVTQLKTLSIPHSMIVTGAGRGVTFLTGAGFDIHFNCNKKVTFMDMTVHKTQGHGLCTTIPIPIDCVRMHFDQCGEHGVHVDYDKDVCIRFTNCQITGSKSAGICFNPHNKIIQIEGAETLLEDNALGDVISPADYQFKNEKEFLAANPNATRTQSCIQILLPLTNMVDISDATTGFGSEGDETITVSLVDSF